MIIATALALSGATQRPQATLMTALPLVWGEGDARDILQGRSARSPTLVAIEKTIDVRAIDVISRRALGTAVAIIAQPRRLLPSELVAFDAWIRDGGRALIFADPELVWPSGLALGDSRRAPPVELLDPLLTHWGVALGDSDGAPTTVQIDGKSVRLMASGKWAGPTACTVIVAPVLDCRIGKGRVLLVGDADILDARVWQPAGGDNAEWVAAQVHRLSRATTSASDLTSAVVIGGIFVAIMAIGLLILEYRREQT